MSHARCVRWTICLCFATACVTAPEPVSLDTAIDAERLEVLIERARSGVVRADSVDGEGARVVRALRRGTLTLFSLRERLCSSQDSKVDCGALTPPAWLGEPTGFVPGPTELHARIEWLRGTAQPFIAVGCAAGQAREGDLFCSVE